jgi:hypothetical protein
MAPRDSMLVDSATTVDKKRKGSRACGEAMSEESRCRAASKTAARRRGDGCELFPRLTVLTLRDCYSMSCSFAGLVLLSSELLHEASTLESARTGWFTLGRAIGRSYLHTAVRILCSTLWIDPTRPALSVPACKVWLESWTDSWLLMALEGRLVHALISYECDMPPLCSVICYVL